MYYYFNYMVCIIIFFINRKAHIESEINHNKVIKTNLIKSREIFTLAWLRTPFQWHIDRVRNFHICPEIQFLFVCVWPDYRIDPENCK